MTDQGREAYERGQDRLRRLLDSVSQEEQLIGSLYESLKNRQADKEALLIDAVSLLGDQTTGDPVKDYIIRNHVYIKDFNNLFDNPISNSIFRLAEKVKASVGQPVMVVRIERKERFQISRFQQTGSFAPEPERYFRHYDIHLGVVRSPNLCFDFPVQDFLEVPADSTQWIASGQTEWLELDDTGIILPSFDDMMLTFRNVRWEDGSEHLIYCGGGRVADEYYMALVGVEEMARFCKDCEDKQLAGILYKWLEQNFRFLREPVLDKDE